MIELDIKTATNLVLLLQWMLEGLDNRGIVMDFSKIPPHSRQYLSENGVSEESLRDIFIGECSTAIQRIGRAAEKAAKEEFGETRGKENILFVSPLGKDGFEA